MHPPLCWDIRNVYFENTGLKKTVEKYNIQDHKKLFRRGIVKAAATQSQDVGVRFRGRGLCCKRKCKYKLER